VGRVAGLKAQQLAPAALSFNPVMRQTSFFARVLGEDDGLAQPVATCRFQLKLYQEI